MANNGQQLIVKIEQQRGVTIVTPWSTRMELAQLPGVLEQVLKLCADGKRQFVVDFSRVQWMTPSLPGILVDLREKIEELGGTLRLAGLNRQAKASLEIHKIEDEFDLYDSADGALRSFGSRKGRVTYAEW